MSESLTHFCRQLFPLFVAIFCFLKKKAKGFPLQSGLMSQQSEFLELM
jgi:hypothetical protein